MKSTRNNTILEIVRQRCLGGFHVIGLTALTILVILNSGCSTSASSVYSDSEREHRNRIAVESAKASIDKFRKGEIKITVVNESGRPVPDASITIRQISHSFKFGCYLKIDDLDPAKLPNYQRRFSALFNYAVIGTYWDATENKRGEENWSWFDREAELARQMGMRIQAAPVLWGTNKYGTPAWLPRDTSELRAALDRRVRSVVSRNANVADWEIVNEPLAPKKDAFASVGTNEYVASAFRSAKEAAPAGRHLINEFGIFGSIDKHNYNRNRYFELLQRLIANNVPIDVIGIQAHANREWFEPADVADQLKRYGSLGRPLQITEFSVQTANFNDRRLPEAISGPYRTGNWDDDKQAEFYREFYTVAFGDPNVEAIVTWGLDDERAWLPGIGLIDNNGEPKAAYTELDRLINTEWKTNDAARTDGNGVHVSRGFLGEYEITAASGSKRATAKFTLTSGGKSNWIVKLRD